jgi:hypothetical protein
MSVSDQSDGFIPLPPNFETADAEANDFFALWDNGADDNTLIASVRKMSSLGLAIVEARFKQRDIVTADRNES